MERNHANENKRAAKMSARNAEAANRRLLLRVGGFRFDYVYDVLWIRRVQI